MSEVKICDRCGRIVELLYQDDSWRYEIIKDCHPYPVKIKIDLCNDCKKDLKRWLGRKRGIIDVNRSNRNPGNA